MPNLPVHPTHPLPVVSITSVLYICVSFFFLNKIISTKNFFFRFRREVASSPAYFFFNYSRSIFASRRLSKMSTLFSNHPRAQTSSITHPTPTPQLHSSLLRASRSTRAETLGHPLLLFFVCFLLLILPSRSFSLDYPCIPLSPIVWGKLCSQTQQSSDPRCVGSPTPPSHSL